MPLVEAHARTERALVDSRGLRKPAARASTVAANTVLANQLSAELTWESAFTGTSPHFTPAQHKTKAPATIAPAAIRLVDPCASMS